MIIFVEAIFSLVIEALFVRALISVLLSLAAQQHVLYLDNVLTYGLLRAESTGAQHAVCSWDSDLKQCIAGAKSLALVDNLNRLVVKIVTPPKSEWSFSSFTPSCERLILSTTTAGVINGHFRLKSIFGDLAITLSPSGRFKFVNKPFSDNKFLLMRRDETPVDVYGSCY